jgi:hypothetical protein
VKFFPDRAAGLEVIFRALAGVLILTVLPLTLMIPDTARQRWRLERTAAALPMRPTAFDAASNTTAPHLVRPE